LRIGKFFEEVLGYDIFQEISKEHTVKDRYVDYAIKINGKIMFFVEVKQSGITLKKWHIEQASNCAANADIPWVLLTNGRFWQLYHLTFDEGIQSDLIWLTDITENDTRESSSLISLLHRKSIVKGELEDFYTKTKALSPKSIVQAIFQEDALRIIRRNLKLISGVSVDEEELVHSIKGMISKDAWEEIGDIKIKRKKRPQKPSLKKATTDQKIIKNETQQSTNDQCTPVQNDTSKNVI